MSHYLDLDFLCLMICEHVYDEVDAMDKICRGPVLNNKSFKAMLKEPQPLQRTELTYDGKRTYFTDLELQNLEPHDVDEYYNDRPSKKNSLADLASLRLVTRSLCKVAATFLFRDIECNLTVSDVNNHFLPILRLDELSRSPVGQCIRTLHLSSLIKESSRPRGPIPKPAKGVELEGWQFRLPSGGPMLVGAQNKDPKSRALSWEMLLLLQDSVKRLPLIRRFNIQGPTKALEGEGRQDTKCWRALTFFLNKLFDGLEVYPSELRMRLARRTGFEVALPDVDDMEATMTRLEPLRYLKLQSTIESYKGIHGSKKDLVDQRLSHKIKNAKKLEVISLTFANRFRLMPTTFTLMRNLHTLHMHKVATGVDFFACIVENCRIRSLSLAWVELDAGYWDAGLKELLKSTTLRRLSVWNCGYVPMGKSHDARRISGLIQPLRTNRQEDLDALNEIMRHANESLLQEGVKTATHAGADHVPEPDPQYRALSCSDANWRCVDMLARPANARSSYVDGRSRRDHRRAENW